MTLYEILEVFKSTSEEAFNVIVKGNEKEFIFNNKIDFYRMRQAVEYYEDAEDKHIAYYADKAVLSIDMINNIITIEE